MNGTWISTVLAALVVFAAVLLWPSTASAHCDTEDGPAVRDGRAALDTGNINHALRWIPAEGEPELREAFVRALDARRAGAGAAEAEADQAFLEVLVRLHRAGEGAGYDGIKPSGTAVDPVVRAADAALVSGSLDEVAGLVEGTRLPELRVLFARVLDRRDFDVDDVAAGRAYVEAYVAFVKYAEGEEHGEGPAVHAEGSPAVHADETAGGPASRS